MRPLCAGPARLRQTSWTVIGIAAILGMTAAPAAADAERKPDPDGVLAAGRELFLKEWTPGLPSRHGGDGLGPVYNESSCVACHNQGGIGGGGAEARNVQLLTNSPGLAGEFRSGAGKRLRPANPSELGNSTPAPEVELASLHVGFESGASVVAHRFSTDRDYETWRTKLLSDEHQSVTLAQVTAESSPRGQARSNAANLRMLSEPLGNMIRKDPFVFVLTERNPPPLFGLGLIDRLPDALIEAAEARSKVGKFGTPGRVSRRDDGRIGRFGWKAQAATLGEFVRIACATELGLDVPGRCQSPHPRDKSYHSPAVDLDADECDALTAYVASLAAPVERLPEGEQEADLAREGVKIFSRIGCAECHTPVLGPLVGVYSDLLLHDMGQDLGGSGYYDELLPRQLLDGNGQEIAGPKSTEWRTPPLWGLRDSAPYLHDGRARTLDEAIAYHGGQADLIANRYFKLSPDERRKLQLFLKSLVAPGQERAGERKS